MDGGGWRVSGILRAMESPRIDDLGFPRGTGRGKPERGRERRLDCNAMACRSLLAVREADG